MSTIGDYIKQERKRAGLTQEEFALRAGLGLRFVRELEQGKETVRMDKVNCLAWRQLPEGLGNEWNLQESNRLCAKDAGRQTGRD